MSIENWLYYVIAVFILTAAPGPSVLLCMTKAVTDGLRPAIYMALGSLTAISAILTLSFTGLGLVVANSEWLFNTIKWLGAGYLVYLGFKAFVSKVDSYSVAVGVASDERFINNYMSGFIVGASNPKAIAFFVALFPQFIDITEPLITQYIVFLTTFVFFESFWLLIYSYLGYRSSDWLLAKGRAQFFNKVTGGVFVGAGLLLSGSSRT